MPTADISCPLVWSLSAAVVLLNNLLPPLDAIPLDVSYNLFENALLLLLNQIKSGWKPTEIDLLLVPSPVQVTAPNCLLG